MQRQWPSTHQGRRCSAPLVFSAAAVQPVSAGTALQQRRQLLALQQVPAAAAPAPPKDAPAPQAAPAARQQQHAAAEAARMAAAAVAPRDSQAYIPAATPLRRAMQLTAHIHRRRHWSQLQNIWLDNSSSFSTIHLTATLSRLAQLVAAQGVPAADGPELFKFSSALMSCLHQRLPELDPRGAAQCLHAYAKLQACCPHHSSSGDAAADSLAATLVAQHMPLLQRQELSQAAWAAAMLWPLGLRLPGGWWGALEQRLLELLPVARPAEVACCAWAAAKAQHVPSPAVVQGLLDHADSRYSRASDSTGQEPYGAAELLQLLLAVAAWKQRPSEAWLLRAQQQLQQQAPGMNAQDVSNTLLAAARLGFTPSAALLGALLQRLQQQLPHSCPRVLATVPHALARLSLNPGQGWWAVFLPYTAVALRSFSPTALALTAWSLARLGVHPGQPWLQELLSESRSRLRRQVPGLAGAASCQGFAAQELAMLAWALGKWGAAPQPAWWQAFEAATAARLEDFTAAELGALLCGMGNTAPALAGAAAQPTTARTTLAGMLSGTGSSSDSDSDGSSSSSSSWGSDPACQHTLLLPDCPAYSPSNAWAARLLQASENALPGAPAGCLAGVLMGLAKLGIRPGSAWLGKFQAAATAALPQATLRDVAALLWGFAVLQVQPSSSLMQGMSGRISQQLQRRLHLLQQQRQASSSSSSSCVNHSTSSVSGPAAAAAAAAARGSPALSPAVAAQLLWSLANLPLAAEAAWLDELLAAVRPELPAASSDTLVTLLWGLARLRHAPGCPGWLDCWWDAYASQLQAERALPSQALQVAGSDGEGDGNGDGDDPALVPLLLVLSSFRQLRATPSPGSGWLPVLLDAVGPHLPTASSAQLCLLLGQLVRLHVWPGEAWLAAAVAAVQRRHCGLAEAGVERLLQDLELLGCARLELDREACIVF